MAKVTYKGNKTYDTITDVSAKGDDEVYVEENTTIGGETSIHADDTTPVPAPKKPENHVKKGFLTKIGEMLGETVGKLIISGVISLVLLFFKILFGILF